MHPKPTKPPIHSSSSLTNSPLSPMHLPRYLSLLSTPNQTSLTLLLDTLHLPPALLSPPLHPPTSSSPIPPLFSSFSPPPLSSPSPPSSSSSSPSSSPPCSTLSPSILSALFSASPTAPTPPPFQPPSSFNPLSTSTSSPLPHRLNPHPTPSRTCPPSPKQPPLPSSSFRTARSRLLGKRLHHSTLSKSVPSPPPHAPCSDPALVATRAVLGNNPTVSRHPPSAKRQKPRQSPLPDVPNVDPKLVEMIVQEVLDMKGGVKWADIAGLQFAKRCVMEAVIWPMRRPDIFCGLRGMVKGVLLFGPPGTGKTMIGRAIASQSGARFLNISASSLMSKWMGEGEKLVRALFGVAKSFQPSVIFIDEVDSLLTQRVEGEQEGSRRIKTEFLVQMDGVGSCKEDRVLVVGATNRPQELDEAARRRLVKRLYIPLPDYEARVGLVEKLLGDMTHELGRKELEEVAKITDGYSGSDLYAVCGEAALGPVRELGETITSVQVGDVRGVSLEDFKSAVKMVRASVGGGELGGYVEWNRKFGSFPAAEEADAKASGGFQDASCDVVANKGN